MSPVQYQKLLGLQEVKRLMLAEMADATSAGRHLGYLSSHNSAGNTDVSTEILGLGHLEDAGANLRLNSRHRMR
jgi:hypothetical protein